MRKSKKEKYVLAYGFRRYSACKKLGWTSVPAFIQDEDGKPSQVKNLPLDCIHIVDNTRLDKSDDAFTELMQSIKQQGLLQPVGVWPVNALDREAFIVKNLTENIHREGLSPFELSKACRELQKMGLNSGEIGVRLSLPKSRIDNILALTVTFPEETMRNASFVQNKRDKKGKIPVSVLNTISHLRTGDKTAVKKLIEVVKDNQWGMVDVQMVSELVGGGMDIDHAIKKKDDYIVISPRIILKKDAIDKIGLKVNSKYIRGVLKGKVPLNKDIFY